MKPTSLATIAALAVTLTTSAAFGQNLVSNPSFELGSFADRGDGAMLLGPGSTELTGWSPLGDDLAWVNNSNTFDITTPSGSFFLDLTGDTDSAPAGGVSQLISTTPGQVYHMTLSLGVYNDDPRTVGPVSVLATAGSTSAPFTFSAAGPGNHWGNFSFDFTATDTSTPITIQGTSASDGIYIGVDNVGVTAAPEPSSCALLAMAALIPAMRRRKAGTRHD